MSHPSSIRRTALKASALTVVAALALGTASAAQAAPPAAAGGAAAPAVSVKATKGTLDWGVKKSFRDYVEGPIAQGAIEVTKPATRNPNGTFRWAKGKGEVDTAKDTASVTFRGEVYFYGHDDGSGPQLQLWIDNPRVVIDGGQSTLFADVRSQFFQGEPVEYENLDLVTLDTSGLDLKTNAKGVVKVSHIPTVLTADAEDAFGGFYAAGTAFDDLTFKVKVGS